MNSQLRLALLPDFLEEGWLSMDYCAEQLLAAWPGPLSALRSCPQYRRLMTRLSSSRKAFNFDRAVNRYLLYPKFAKGIRSQFDCFHIVDHSYAHLVHSLPAERTGVYCHDLDAFCSVIEPQSVPRSRWFQALSQRLLTGLQKAAIVFVNSQQTRDQLLQHRLIDASRIVLAPLGIAEEFTLCPASESRPQWLAVLSGKPWILHVGSCIPRKRIDVLLDVFSLAKANLPELQLLKVSGEFSLAQREQIVRLNLGQCITQVSNLSRSELAAVYRAAPLVLIPSESEGFGLPALEAVACGAKVLASDLPALREAGGDAAIYRPVADRAAWAEAVIEAFEHPDSWPDVSSGARQAQRFSWPRHAAIVAEAYESLLSQGSAQ